MITHSKICVKYKLSSQSLTKHGKPGITFAHKRLCNCYRVTEISHFLMHMKNGEMVESSWSQWVLQICLQTAMTREASFKFCAAWDGQQQTNQSLHLREKATHDGIHAYEFGCNDLKSQWVHHLLYQSSAWPWRDECVKCFHLALDTVWQHQSPQAYRRA